MKWVNQPLLQNEMEEIEKIFFSAAFTQIFFINSGIYH